MIKKYIFQDCNTDNIKTILATSEYKAQTQNFGNLEGYKFVNTLPLHVRPMKDYGSLVK
jgi:uncharacterized protein YggE